MNKKQLEIEKDKLISETKDLLVYVVLCFPLYLLMSIEIIYMLMALIIFGWIYLAILFIFPIVIIHNFIKIMIIKFRIHRLSKTEANYA